jgi:DNA-binding CsgD family transcriptional regulator
MTVLTARDLRAVLQFAEQAAAVDDFAELRSGLLGWLADVVGAEAATLTHLDLRTRHEVAVLWPPSRVRAVDLERYAEHAPAHPLRPVLARNLREGRHDVPAIRISDVLSSRQWRQHPLYREAMRDVHDQLSLPIRSTRSAIQVVALARSGRPFSDRQSALLTSTGRHVAAAVRRARREGRHALQIAPTLGWVDAADAPGLARAEQPGPGPAEAPLRPRLVAPVAPAGLVVPVAPAGLVVPVGPRDGTARPGLTRREGEVLALIAAGLTDAQVARRLDLSTATVSKHLHRVYSRLGLPNRVAAAQYWNRHGGAAARHPARNG